MKIAIRMDDITPDMDWKSFDAFRKVLDAHGICPLIGVVPCNQDENLKREAVRADFYDKLKEWESRGWVIAQHGCYHKYTTKKGGCFPLNHFSEYAGVAYARQKEMIAKGRAVLEEKGFYPKVFMAPGHTFDKSTLKALKECGFSYVTDGFGNRPYLRQELTFLPISARKNDCFRKKEGYTTLTVHTNGMTQKELGWYERNMAEHAECFISYGDLLAQPAVVRGLTGRMAEYVMAHTKWLMVRILMLRTLYRVRRKK